MSIDEVLLTQDCFFLLSPSIVAGLIAKFLRKRTFMPWFLVGVGITIAGYSTVFYVYVVIELRIGYLVDLLMSITMVLPTFIVLLLKKKQLREGNRT